MMNHNRFDKSRSLFFGVANCYVCSHGRCISLLKIIRQNLSLILLCHKSEPYPVLARKNLNLILIFPNRALMVKNDMERILFQICQLLVITFFVSNDFWFWFQIHLRGNHWHIWGFPIFFKVVNHLPHFFEIQLSVILVSKFYLAWLVLSSFPRVFKQVNQSYYTLFGSDNII